MGDKNIQYCSTIDEALQDADLCLIFTEWDEVKNLDVNKYKTLMKHPIVIDGRNCYALDRFENTGVTYESIGRRIVNSAE